MALTTRCPQCGTSFKVVPDQLRVRNGLVRCGACATVFDGRACLLPESATTPADLPSAAGPKPAGAAPTVAVPAAAVPSAPAPFSAPPIAAPVLATPVALPPLARADEAPVVQRPSSEAPPLPAIPPAVLRGRDDIRRRIEPDAVLAQEGDDDEDENEDLDRYDDAPAPRWQEPAAPAWRDEPIVAVRDTPPAAHGNAPRSPAPAEPVFVVRDEPRDEPRDDPDADADPEDDPDADPREPILGDARTRYSSATDVGRAPPEFLDQDRQERRGLMRKVWGYACLVGLIALGLQLLYVYRVDIANSVPVLRPALEAACKPMGCTVGYARRLERIAISSSSLQPPTGAAAIDDGRTRLVLNLVLRNRYDKPQHWPALVLDLTDLSDTVVVRRVLMPENYLTPDQLQGPFGPAGELKISVPIEVTGVQVNGYQLDKFFP
ncbi:DUF3426 domain-containing protein [Achromobacter sp. NCFB-sbj8-Ac1-l]|uniref:DUF3426 domain-containing protein n=1 Tax=unclassified Achromobacter TaxID=2626865 RepID=UPI004046E32F